MYDGSYTPTLGGDSSPDTDTTLTPSASGPVPVPTRATPMVQFASGRFQVSLGSQNPLEPVIQPEGAFQLLQRNPSGVYSGGTSHDFDFSSNATATSSSLQGDVTAPGPTIIPYGSLPIAVPNVPNGQAGSANPTNVHAAGLPPWFERFPEVFAAPDARGTSPSWMLVHADLDYPGGDDLRVIIHFTRLPL